MFIFSMTELKGIPKSISAADLLQTASLPLIIREKDVEYQVLVNIICLSCHNSRRNGQV
jgi:hypothetical protein